MNRFLLSIVAAAILTGCSNRPADDLLYPERSNLPIVIYKPELPAPLVLADENFMQCVVEGQQMVCMTIAEAKAMLANKVAVGLWIERARNIMLYYENHPNLKAKQKPKK